MKNQSQFNVDVDVYHDNVSFDSFVRNMNERFNSNLAAFGPALFETDIDLFSVYLAAFPDDARQYHNCHCCKDFLNRYGRLVFIDSLGNQVSAFWDPSDAPEHYKDVTEVMKMVVETASITKQFITSEIEWGKKITGLWHHFAITPIDSLVHKSRVKTASELAAERLEDYRILCQSIADFNQAAAQLAVVIVESDTLYRVEKVRGVALWFEQLHNSIHQKRGATRKRIIWKAVATAPIGFTHIRSSMIGTLLEDIKNKLSHTDIKNRFAAKMHPLQYQRPTAAPTAGNVKQAEEIVQKMGIENSLKRRVATLDDMEKFWIPAVVQPSTQGGVFGDLLKKAGDDIMMDVTDITAITWEKFYATVLPAATKIEVLVPYVGAFSSFLTAEDMTAPPIIQWDNIERRNPMSWYFHAGEARAETWNLKSSTYVEVKALGWKPNMLSEQVTNQGRGVMFALDGCFDKRGATACLFPEILKSELHQIRSTIEAHSNRTQLEQPNGQAAAGILSDFSKPKGHIVVRVSRLGGRQKFKIDRWD